MNSVIRTRLEILVIRFKNHEDRALAWKDGYDDCEFDEVPWRLTNLVGSMNTICIEYPDHKPVLESMLRSNGYRLIDGGDTISVATEHWTVGTPPVTFKPISIFRYLLTRFSGRLS